MSALDTVANRLIEVLEGVCSLSFFFVFWILLAEVEGGGDFSLGDVGHAGELWPDLKPLSLRVPSVVPSTLPSGRIGLCADKAR